MTAGNQAFWLEKDNALPIAVPICPCCQRPLRIDAEVFDLAIDLAEQIWHVTRPMILGAGRARPVVKARALIIWGLRRLRPDLSYTAIGRMMGRHHSTIVDLHQVAISRRLNDPVFAQACHSLVFAATGEREKLDVPQ